LEFDVLLPLGGFIVGMVIGLTGLGGGSLMTPGLIFGLGIPPAIAVGTDLVFAGITKSIGVFAHRAARNIDWSAVRWMALGSLPSALATILIVERFLPSRAGLDATIVPILGVALILTALVLICRSRLARFAEGFANTHGEPKDYWLLVAGVVLGSLVALSSVGAGAMGVAVVTMCRPGMITRRLVGTDLAHAFPLALVAGLGHLHLGTVDFGLLFALLMGSIPGIYVGSTLTSHVPEPVLRCLLAAVLVTAGLLCIL
jgi:uncharacterized membrane protein YfcA